MEKEGFKYYAFISYSHKDQKIAKKLQVRLERYHLPAALLKSYPELPKNLSPIFIDESNLVAKGSLKTALQANLDNSNYLIIICSPNSAKSEYVNDEVEYFIKAGRADHIIPLIVDGVPHSEDTSLECFVPALLELPRDIEPLGIDLKKFGKRDAFLRVIATMLELDLDSFISREARERKKRAIIFTPVAAALLIIAGILVWYNIPHYKYYSSYVYKWEKPVGLFEVKSEADRKKMEYTYRFTNLRGRVQKIERVNSAGILVDPAIITSFTELPMINFLSDRTVEHYDVNGNKVFRKEYTQNMQAVDFYRGEDDLPYTIKPDMLNFYEIKEFYSEIDSRENDGNIIRLTLEHDDNGYLIRKTFRLNNNGGYDNKGVTVQDEYGRGGIIYTLDDFGRVINIRYMDKYREAMTVDGVYSEQIEYGGTPYPVKISFVDKNGNLISNFNDVAVVNISYDKYFNVSKSSCYNANQERVLDNLNNVSETVFVHNIENGFLISESFYDAALNPVCIYRSDYAQVEFVRDFEGRITKWRFYDVKSERIIRPEDFADYDPDEEYKLGIKYREAEDYKISLEHFTNAAKRGHVAAQVLLGNMYYNGEKVEKDYKQAFKWYKKASEQGNAAAQNSLGDMYKYGQRIIQDYKRAFELYSKAAAQGYTQAQNNLGLMYYYGYGIGQDYKQAFENFHKSAENGNAEAQAMLGTIYQNGYGVEKDYKQALEWYHKAIEQDNAIAQNHLGEMYYKGEGVKQDYKHALEWYNKAAKQKNSDAQFNLGFMYYDAKGIKQDYSQALEWYLKAAEQGNVKAQYYLGEMYFHGYGVKQDNEQAFEWYQKSAEQGYADAQYSLGRMYEDKEDYTKSLELFQKAADQGHVEAQNYVDDILAWSPGAGRRAAYEEFQEAAEQGDDEAQYNLANMYYDDWDYEQALKWYQKAAEQGNDDAQFTLGDMYYNGEVVKQNYKRAFELYNKSAEQGNIDAYTNLGYMYYEGQGIEKEDYKKAFELFQKAAEHGDEIAFFNIGEMYEYGKYVEKNPQIAYMWYYMAHLAEDEDEETKDRLNNLSSILSEAQITEAKNQAQKKFNEINERN